MRTVTRLDPPPRGQTWADVYQTPTAIRQRRSLAGWLRQRRCGPMAGNSVALLAGELRSTSGARRTSCNKHVLGDRPPGRGALARRSAALPRPHGPVFGAAFFLLLSPTDNTSAALLARPARGARQNERPAKEYSFPCHFAPGTARVQWPHPQVRAWCVSQRRVQ